MEANILGQSIKLIRKAKGITQEALAEAVNVSPQAVSKWESGGYPDASLIPEIADFLQVTIDELYGRNSENPDFMEQMLAYLHEVDSDERIERLYEMCRVACSSFCGNTLYNEILFPKNKQGNCVFSQYTGEKGIVQARVDSNKPFFVIIPELEKGYDITVPYSENLVKLFEFLAMPDALRAMYYLQSLRGKFINSQTFVQELGISKESAENIIAKLLDMHFVWEADFERGDKNEKIYSFSFQFGDFVEFIYFADNLLTASDTNHNFNFQSEMRKSPYFKNKSYKK